MFRHFCRAMMLVLLLPCIASAEIIQGSQIASGEWTGGAYVFDETGEFSHCVVSANYQSGDTLLLSVQRDGSVGVSIFNSKWDIAEDWSEFVVVEIDNFRPLIGKAKFINNKMAGVFFDDLDRALYSLQKGYVMNLIINEKKFASYKLTGTYRALSAVRRCAADYYNYKVTVDSKEVDAVDRLPLSAVYQIAIDVVRDLPNSGEFLSDDELSQYLPSYQVGWIGEGYIAAITSTRLPNTDLREVANHIIKGDAEGCTGDFASGSLGSSQDGSHRRVSAMCTSDDSDWQANYGVYRHGEYIIQVGVVNLGQSSETTNKSVNIDAIFQTVGLRLSK